MDALGRVSVLRDGTAFRPASAPHPLLLENHLYSSFTHPDNSAHSHTAPHTPTELEREIERERCEEKGHDDQKDSGAEGNNVIPYSLSTRRESHVSRRVIIKMHDVYYQ